MRRWRSARPRDQARQILGAAGGVTDQRIYAGYVGTADGVDPVLTTALIAPAQDRFPLELPTMVAGHLPDPRAADQVFVNSAAAKQGGLRVGQRLHFRFRVPLSPVTGEQVVTITGIGSLPAEPVADDSLIVGVFVFTHAFYDAHDDLATYAVSNVDLAAGVDARRDLAPEIGKLGFAIQSVRSQERHAVGEALRPVVIVLVALGIVAFVATLVGATQVVQRNRERHRADDARLLTLGMSTAQLRTSELAQSAAIGLLAVVTALVTMLVASPLAPIGPLHDLDPARLRPRPHGRGPRGPADPLQPRGSDPHHLGGARAAGALDDPGRSVARAAACRRHDRHRAVAGLATGPGERTGPQSPIDPRHGRRHRDRGVLRRLRRFGGRAHQHPVAVRVRHRPRRAQRLRRPVARRPAARVRDP